MNERDQQKARIRLRRRMRLVQVFFVFALIGLCARAVHRQVLDEQFLVEQGEARHLRVEQIAAHRGSITDRNGEPLGVSSPVDSVWVNPRELAESGADVNDLAKTLGVDAGELMRKVSRSTDRSSSPAPPWATASSGKAKNTAASNAARVRDNGMSGSMESCGSCAAREANSTIIDHCPASSPRTKVLP